MVISNMCVVFAAHYLPQEGGGELFCSNGGGDPLYALLEGALIVSSDYTLRKKLKAAGVKYGNNGVRRTS
jgi:hypothetical protein